MTQSRYDASVIVDVSLGSDKIIQLDVAMLTAVPLQIKVRYAVGVMAKMVLWAITACSGDTNILQRKCVAWAGPQLR